MTTKKQSTAFPKSIAIGTIGVALSLANLLCAEPATLPTIGEGKLNLDARVRYEYNGLNNGSDDINGFGLRTRLGYTIGEGEDLSAMVEVEDIHFIDSKDRPGLDVPTTELNQAWVSAQGAKIGRQIYTLDDHRFIGHVGWRQNIQTFDAITGSIDIDSDSKLNLGYLHTVQRVNATSQDLSGILVNGSRKISDAFSLTAFAYLLDFDKPVLASSDSFGLRATGNFATNEEKYGYMLSYAKQSDNGGSVSSFDLDYIAGELTATSSGITLGLGFELLEGDGTTGFTTPLATVHKFNGFADQFAGGSLGLGGGLHQGLEDYYARLSFTFPDSDIPLTLSYHEFHTENVNDFLGSEIDAVATYKLNDNIQLLTKYAFYDSDLRENVGYGGVDKTVFTVEANIKY